MASFKRTKQLDFYVYVDTVVFTINRNRDTLPEDRLEVLVMQRPERKANKWALPGGLVEDQEALADAALRKVATETGITLKKRDIHQVGAFGNPDRDERFRAIAIAYMALVPHPGELNPQEHADNAAFKKYSELAKNKMLEFDHAEIINSARTAARKMLEDTSVALSFCQPKFTISDVRHVYEAFLQTSVDAANFRRKIEAVSGFVVPLDEYADFGSFPGRPPQMYKAGKLGNLPTPIRFRSTTDSLG